MHSLHTEHISQNAKTRNESSAVPIAMKSFSNGYEFADTGAQANTDYLNGDNEGLVIIVNRAFAKRESAHLLP